MEQDLDFLGFNPADVFTETQSSRGASNSNNLIYKPRPDESISEDGIYRSTIQVIYSPQTFKHVDQAGNVRYGWDERSILHQQTYTLHDAHGWLTVVSSLTNNDTSCPLFTAWKKCHFSRPEESDAARILYNQALSTDKGGKGLFNRRQPCYVTIRVIEDANHPELNGQYMFMKLPKSIRELIETTSKTSEADNHPGIPVMDLLYGRAIKLQVIPGEDDKAHPERRLREQSYKGAISKGVVTCTYPDGSSVLTPDEQAVLNEYISEMKQRVWDNDEWETMSSTTFKEKLSETIADIKSKENTKKVGAIYKKAIETFATFIPDLNAELGYKEWTPEVKERVQQWIDIVLSGNDPAAMNVAAPVTSTVASAVNEAVEQRPVETAQPQVTPPFDTIDDLPF